MSLSTILRELAAAAVEAIRDEWNSRTTYGKAWFPVWLLWSVYRWTVVLFILALIAVAVRIVTVLDSAERTGESLTPNTHKDEVDDR